MTISDQDVKALHLEGGNYFDDMRIDIAESHQRFANLTRNAKNIKRPKYHQILSHRNSLAPWYLRVLSSEWNQQEMA